jgi:hypothetical protein
MSNQEWDSAPIIDLVQRLAKDMTVRTLAATFDHHVHLGTITREQANAMIAEPFPGFPTG